MCDLVLNDRFDVVQDDQPDAVEHRGQVRGPEHVPDVALLGEALGHQLEGQLINLGRQLRMAAAVDPPIGLQIFDHLGQVLPGRVVLLEPRDEQQMEDQPQIRLSAQRPPIVLDAHVGIRGAEQPLLLHADQHQRDRFFLEAERIHLLALKECHLVGDWIVDASCQLGAQIRIQLTAHENERTPDHLIIRSTNPRSLETNTQIGISGQVEIARNRSW